ncbi:MAG: hypothetical protein IT342_17930 [Candidatus Melainabacteria bacterium]|nr:hypothetical protein [Candidatus Melainabacteria bacterium]
MTEIIKACKGSDQIDPVPQAFSHVASQLHECAYGPASIAPHGPAFDGTWRACPPGGGILQELPMGSIPKETSMGGGGWQRVPFADKLPRGCSPYLQEMELINPGIPNNKYIGYARSAGSAGFDGRRKI